MNAAYAVVILVVLQLYRPQILKDWNHSITATIAVADHNQGFNLQLWFRCNPWCCRKCGWRGCNCSHDAVTVTPKTLILQLKLWAKLLFFKLWPQFETLGVSRLFQGWNDVFYGEVDIEIKLLEIWRTK